MGRDLWACWQECAGAGFVACRRRLCLLVSLIWGSVEPSFSWARTSQRSCRGGFAAPARARMPEGVRIAYCDSGAGNLGGWGLGRARSRGGFAGGVSLRVRVSFGWFQVREKLNSS